MRTGAYALTLIAEPLNILALRVLGAGPATVLELSSQIGSPAPTTFRSHLGKLIDLGVVERRREESHPEDYSYALGAPGRDLLGVADVLQAWLADSPAGPLDLGTPAAKSAVKAVADAWSSNMLRALAVRPLGITELDSIVAGASYPALQRRLAAMRSAGQVEPCPSSGRTQYTVTDWLRRATAPLASAARWERRRVPATAAPITRIDIESAFLLVVPMLSLPAGLSGSCRLAVEVDRRGGNRMAGVMVEVDSGRIASCSSDLGGSPDASAFGSGPDWLDAVLGRRPERLRLDGRPELASPLVTGLHDLLFSAAPDN